MSAMKLLSLMINNTRKYHSISPKWNFLINTQGGNKLFTGIIKYLKKFSCIISNQITVSHTQLLLMHSTFYIYQHICNFLGIPPGSISWCYIPLILWTFLESSKRSDQLIHAPSLFVVWSQSLLSVDSSLLILNIKSSLILGKFLQATVAGIHVHHIAFQVHIAVDLNN